MEIEQEIQISSLEERIGPASAISEQDSPFREEQFDYAELMGYPVIGFAQ